MQPLQIVAYSLTVLADLQILLGIILTLTAMVTDKQLRQRSNIMIAFLLLPDLMRVLLCNLHVVESFNPELWHLPDTACLVIARWGLMSCFSGTLWLLVANSVHRYFLCVKMRSGIDSTKMSLVISAGTLITSVSMIAVMGTFAKWEIIFNDTVQQVITPLSQNETFANLLSFTTRNSTGTDPSEISAMNNGSLACKNRHNVMDMSQSIKGTSALVIYIIPMIIQIYFYSKIYHHLNQQRKRFESNQQVVVRLNRNSRAIVRTLLVSFLSHFLALVPLWLISSFIDSTVLDLVLRIILLNATLAGAISFLFLHGGYR